MKTNTLNPPWILVARIGWVLITLFFLTTFILGLPYRYRELATACDAPTCPPLTLSSADAASIDSTLFSMQGYAAFHIGIELITALLMSVMAVLIFWKYFDNLLGILTAYLLIYIGLAGFVQAGFVFAVQYPSVEWFYNLLFALFDPLILLVIFIFPTGQFLNKLSLSVFIFIIFLWLLDKILVQNGIDIMGDVGTILFLAAFAFGIWSQIYRYRNISTAVEKQQTKWVLVGVTSLLFCIAGWVLLVDIFPPSTPQTLFLTNTVGIAVIFLFAYLFPITMIIAIMRYGLWGIDVIIRRTVQYAIVSAVLAIVYFGSITLIQGGLTAVTNTQSPLAIVLSTLLVAALFNPLRRRVQAFIDRRFYRQKYDAQQVLAQFAQTARDETDMAMLTAELVRVVQDTMQPSAAGLWLYRGSGGSQPDGSERNR